MKNIVGDVIGSETLVILGKELVVLGERTKAQCLRWYWMMNIVGDVIGSETLVILSEELVILSKAKDPL
jgi:hypothetical protein